MTLDSIHHSFVCVLYIGLSPSLQRKTFWYLSRKLWIKDWTSPLGIQNRTVSSLAKYVVMILKSWRTSENSVIWPRLVRTGTFSLQKLVLVNVLVIDNPFWTHTIEFIIQYVDKVIKLTRCRLRSEEAILTLVEAVGGTKAGEKLSLTLEKLHGGSKQGSSS